MDSRSFRLANTRATPSASKPRRLRLRLRCVCRAHQLREGLLHEERGELVSSFRARARTVDLLGRQQIAGIPTAVSELFKNAHDAYATRVEGDFYRLEQLLVLRDDGLGMSPEDFEERWLTLGTDSKVGDKRGIKPPPKLAGQERPVLGEKGIGRLAIASIGSQVLVLTRARGSGKRALTAALINWRLFELPGANLQDVKVPMLRLEDGALPDKRALNRMTKEIRDLLDGLEANPKEREAINADLDLLTFDPAALVEGLGPPRLSGARGHGTSFLIIPTSEQLIADIEGPPDEDVAPPLVKTLVGFANTMTPDAPQARIKTAFRDHRSADDSKDIIGEQAFFTPEDWSDADHHIKGWFDSSGFFTGSVDVYGKGEEKYELAFPSEDGAELDCGAFRLQLSYVQGKPAESRLDPTAYRNLTAKLDLIGGLYIYRDDIRVLPYGNTDFDFLGIELRRSARAGTGFFSYRRMFGVIEINGERNRDLQEKAGREGFRDNRAYRQFRDVLRNFLIQVAATFFNAKGEESEAFLAGKEEAQRRYTQRKSREEDAVRKRKQFEKRLANLLAALADGDPEKAAAKVVDRLRDSLVDLDLSRDEVSAELLTAELSANAELQRVRDSFSLEEPPGYGLTTDLRRDFDYLRLQLDQLDERVFIPAEKEIAKLIREARRTADAPPDRRQRLVSLIEQAVDDAKRRADAGASEAHNAAKSASEAVERASRHSLELIDEVSDEILTSARESVSAPRSDAALVERRLDLERRLDTVFSQEIESLRGLTERLRLVLGGNGNGSRPAASEREISALLEEEVLELRERVDRDFELAQLGMATQVITHELDSAIVEVRENLRRLDAWADVNPKLQELQGQLRGAFEHLDGYLSLFTPLQRRLRRRREKLTGENIEEFLRRLFGQRLDQLGIELEVTDSFRQWTESGFRSTIYPVFVNLVDNSTYWVRQASPPYRVRLDAGPAGLLIEDSGPSVSERDRELIWEYGFSRKPGGRGAGLHISREVLSRDGWSIELVDGKQGSAFLIKPPEGGSSG